MKKKDEREKSYSNRDAAKKLRRLANALEKGKPFSIQIAGRRIRVPATAGVEFEYEQQGLNHQIEIEMEWRERALAK